MSKRLARVFHCPAEFTLAVLERKWKTAILCCLVGGPRRYAELRKRLPGLSDKILSERLAELVASGLVVRGSGVAPRQAGPGASRVRVYSLSALGESLGSLLQELSRWAIEHADALGARLEAPTLPTGSRGPIESPAQRGTRP